MRQTVIDFIIQTILDFGYPIQLTGKSSLVTDAGLDSLDIMDLSAAIKEKYNIGITNEEHGVFKKTIDDVADLIVSKL